VWLSSSLLDFLAKEEPLIRTPRELLLYCAAKHFISDRPMNIVAKDMAKIMEMFPDVEMQVKEAEVRFFRSATCFLVWRRLF
jgi:hypothetical protein